MNGSLCVWHLKIADVHRVQGNLSSALNSARSALAIAKRLTKRDPGDPWSQHLSAAHSTVGEVLREQGNLPAALQSYRSALTIHEHLANAHPGNAGLQRALSANHSQIGEVLRRQGNLAEALRAYKAALAIAERLVEADPANAEWECDICVLQGGIGDVLRDLGDLPEALIAHRAALSIAERLAMFDPRNVGWQSNLSMAQQSIGDVLRAQGDLFEALSAYQGSLAIRERLVKGDPANGQWQAALSDLQAAVSTMLRAQRLPGALESYGAETPAQLQTPAAYGNELAARSHIIMGWWALPVAKPGQPLVMDPRLQSLIDADSAHVLIPILGANRQIWANELDRHLAQQRAQHGCTDEEIMAVAIDELQRLTLPDSPHVDRWSVLFNAVSAEMFRRTGRKRRWYHRLP